MKKNQFLVVMSMLALSLTSSCVKDVKDAVDEASQALKCAERAQEFEDKNEANPDRSCTDIVADLNDIEKTCTEYLSQSTKDQFAELRSQCEAN